MLRELWNRVHDRSRRDALEAELAEELSFHEQMLARDGELLPRRRLGNRTQVQEATRDRWSLGVIDVVLQDIRYAVRGLVKAPGFSVAVIVTLGLGIGANVAMLSITDQLLLRPYPMLRDPAHVHRLYLGSTERGQTDLRSDGIAYSRFRDLASAATTASDMAAFTQITLAVGDRTDPVERKVAVVTGTFFGFFDARPVIGRFIGPVDDTLPRGAAVAVLGYRFWQQRYAGRNVVGETLQVGDVVSTIIGVAPQGFRGIDDVAPDVIVPATTYAAASVGSVGEESFHGNYHWGWLSVMMRRKSDVAVARANADLSRAYRQSWLTERAQESRITPAEIARPFVVVAALKPGAGPDPGREARTAVWVLGVAIVVLLIAVANVTNLHLVRAMRRRRESAVRIALGVSGRRMALLHLTESAVLALGAGIFGLVVAQVVSAVIGRYFVASTAGTALFMDRRIVFATLAITIVVAMITGLVPQVAARTTELAAALRSGARAGTRGRARISGALLLMQGALSVLLLVGAGLFVRSVHAVSTMRLGYDANQVLVARLHRRGVLLGDEAQATVNRHLVDVAAALPGVQHAAWSSALPLYSWASVNLYTAGIDSVDRLGDFTYQATSTDFFATMGTRIVRGRGFNAADDATAPRVMVVSAAMGRTLWPGGDPIGRCVRMRTDTAPCTTVVGVAEDTYQHDLSAPGTIYYVPNEQFARGRGFGLVIRTSGPVASSAQSIQAVLQREMPGDYYVTTEPFAAAVGRETRSWQFGAAMFTAFGILALLVASIGLYALVSYGVAQRSHELSVRVALGARVSQIVTLVVGQGFRFALAGVAIGAALALAAAPRLQPLLFRESARDPLVYGVVGALLIVVAVLAAAVPAVRASRADPNAALRAE